MKNAKRINEIMRKCINHEFNVLGDDPIEVIYPEHIKAYVDISETKLLDIYEEYYGDTYYTLNSIGIENVSFRREIDGKIICLDNDIFKTKRFYNESKYSFCDLEGYLLWENNIKNILLKINLLEKYYCNSHRFTSKVKKINNKKFRRIQKK